MRFHRMLLTEQTHETTGKAHCPFIRARSLWRSVQEGLSYTAAWNGYVLGKTSDRYKLIFYRAMLQTPVRRID